MRRRRPKDFGLKTRAGAGATFTFNQSPLSPAFRSSTGTILKVCRGSNFPFAKPSGNDRFFAVTGASRDRVLTVARLAAAREPHSDVVVALTRCAKRAQPVDHPRLEPDEALAAFVDLVLISRRRNRRIAARDLQVTMAPLALAAAVVAVVIVTMRRGAQARAELRLAGLVAAAIVVLFLALSYLSDLGGR